MKKFNKHDVLLILTAILWGYGFIASANAVNAGFSVFFILFMRFLIGAVAMGVIINTSFVQLTKKELYIGGLSGVFLFISFSLQTYGLSMTTPSNNAFLCSVNVVIVPLILWILTGKKPPKKIVISLIFCSLGTWMLTGGTASAGLNPGDVLSLVSAFVFAMQIVLIGRFSKELNLPLFNFVQMFTVCILAMISCLLFTPQALSFSSVGNYWLDLLYLGVVSTCVCYLFQALGQRGTSTSKAAIILSTESLFGSIFSVALGMEPLTGWLICGGVVILIALFAVELDFGKKK